MAAYAHLTGESWRPYTPAALPGQSVSRQAAELQLAAFGHVGGCCRQGDACDGYLRGIDGKAASDYAA